MAIEAVRKTFANKVSMAVGAVDVEIADDPPEWHQQHDGERDSTSLSHGQTIPKYWAGFVVGARTCLLGRRP